ncbi:transposase, MuDR, MULE transposase domain protein [Tanacetum coccineum]
MIHGNINDSDLNITFVLRSSSSARVEPSPYTPTPVRIIPSPAGTAQGKLKQVVAIVKSCSPNCLGDLNVTMKDLSGTVRGTVHHKLLDVGTYGNDIHVGAAMILANVFVFTPKPSEQYLNITKKNVVKSLVGRNTKRSLA